VFTSLPNITFSDQLQLHLFLNTYRQVTGNMKYESFPPIGNKTNKLLSYIPNDESDAFIYRHEQGRFTPVQGAKVPASFSGRMVHLKHTTSNYFDSCVDFQTYSRGNNRGRRRSHALQLAANYRDMPVSVFEKWLSPEAMLSFKAIITKLRAFCQGSPVTFTSIPEGTVYYRVNQFVMESLCSDLESVRKRTLQLNHDRKEDVFPLPLWSDTFVSDIYEGVYTQNDWEILASTFRQEAETFLQAMLYLGYDYKPIEPEDEEEEEVPCAPYAPEPLDEDVLSLLEASQQINVASVRFTSPPIILEPKRLVSPVRSNESLATPSFNLTRSPQSKELDEPVVLRSSPAHSRASSAPFQFPTSNLPRGSQEVSAPTNLDDSHHSLAIVTPLPESPVPKDPFGPIDPVGEHSIVPSYQMEQLNRVYGAPPSTTDPLHLGPGTDRYNAMFKPSPYAQEPVVSQAQQTDLDSPGAAHNASHSLGRSVFSLPSSVMADMFDMSSGGAKENQSQPPSMSIPSFANFSHGNDSFGPPKPPNGGPPHPNGSPGGGPPGPPGGGGGFPYNAGNPRNNPPNANPHGKRDHPSHGPPGGGPPGPPSPPSGGATDPLGNNPKNNGVILSGLNKWVNVRETHFDTKLKPDIIPTWNGNESTLGRWLMQINELAQRSASVFRGLGDIVPTRFRDQAASWWYSLPDYHRQSVTINWDTLKDEIRTFWMNQSWIEKTQRSAIRAAYRQTGHSNETPMEYYIRKYELYSLVYNFTPSQIMHEILKSAPRLWSTVLNPRSFNTLAEFQTAIKYHEDLLIELGEKYERRYRPSSSSSRSYLVDSRDKKSSSKAKVKSKISKGRVSTRNYAIGSTRPQQSYPHPKDDSNVSPSKTPADYGARGCIFCGSTQHWDRECKYNKGSDLRKARAMFVDYSPDDLIAEAVYERCYTEATEDCTDSTDTPDPEPLEEASSEEETSDQSAETISAEELDF
jgi:hypothetical protein